MYTIFLLLHVIVAIALVVLVLLQQGRGAEAGAAFGSGASSTIFGARGSSSFLSRITAMLATGFFITSLILAYFLTQVTAPASVAEQIQSQPQTEIVSETTEKDKKSDTGPADLPQVPKPDDGTEKN
jgi:preprotein translocase subunit SecG